MQKPHSDEQQEVASAHVPRVKPTAEECRVVEELFARKKLRAPSPYMKVQNTGAVREISVDHPDPSTGHLLLMHSLGTTEADFANGLLTQLGALSGQTGQSEEAGLNFLLSVVKSLEPKDEIEALLAAQMAAVHVAVLTFARRLGGVDTIQQQDSAERALNKLARTFTTQVESLKRYRTGGEQKVAVEHVHVHEGGQAIVGNVESGEGGFKKREVQPHAR